MPSIFHAQCHLYIMENVLFIRRMKDKRSTPTLRSDKYLKKVLLYLRDLKSTVLKTSGIFSNFSKQNSEKFWRQKSPSWNDGNRILYFYTAIWKTIKLINGPEIAVFFCRVDFLKQQHAIFHVKVIFITDFRLIRYY